MNTLSAVPIRSPYVDLILDGRKTWEIRSKNTKKIGPVALIKSGSGTVVGTATLSKVVELTPSVARANAKLMGLSPADAATFAGLYAWVLEDVVKLKKPVPYFHPPGAVVWVTLDEKTARKVNAEAARSKR
jgi:predicted transcriptional regulator